MAKVPCHICKIRSVAASILSEVQMLELEQCSLEASFNKGELLFKQGTRAAGVAYLKTGMVKVHFMGPSREKIIRVVKAPSYIGISSIFGDKLYTYSATAIEYSTVCFIPFDSFTSFIRTNGDFAYEIINDIIRNEVTDYQKFVQLSQKQLPGRTAETLLCMSEKLFGTDIFVLPLSREEFGDLIGTSRESVCRVFNDFKKEGLISIKGKSFEILKKNTLKQIAEKG
jgi:CRP/FNR family transcriptional regulator